MSDAKSMIVAAVIAAIAGLAGVLAGYKTGEKQYQLDHDRTITNLIVSLAEKGSIASAVVRDFCIARVFDDDTRSRLNQIWPQQAGVCPTALNADKK